VSVASVQQYIKSSLDQLPWPSTMGGVAPLNCYITPPNPNVQSEVPTAYVWMARGRESRDTDRLRAGTIPRAATPGGASGTKAVDHTVPVYLVWMMSIDDPDVDNLFPGMIWQVMSALRGSIATPGPGGQVSDPALLTDPWTGEQSWLIDLGEDMSYDSDLRALEDQRYLRYDAVIDCTVIEVIAA
jgi:hypothetical protein